MKLFRYKYVPSAMVATILYALLNVLHAYSLSFLVVQWMGQINSFTRRDEGASHHF